MQRHCTIKLRERERERVTITHNQDRGDVIDKGFYGISLKWRFYWAMVSVELVSPSISLSHTLFLFELNGPKFRYDLTTLQSLRLGI